MVVVVVKAEVEIDVKVKVEVEDEDEPSNFFLPKLTRQGRCGRQISEN